MDKLSAIRNPSESPQVRAIATAVAELERDLHGAVQAHYEALDAEPPEDLAPVDERVDQLCRLVEKQVGGDLWLYFVDEQAPEALENPEKARKHAGKTPEEWEETVAGWADGLRDQLEDVDDVPDRELADRFCKQRFGLDLETFEAAVVQWSPAATLQFALRGRVDADVQRIERATEALEAGSVDDVEAVQEGSEE
jgi:hypothetical protein